MRLRISVKVRCEVVGIWVLLKVGMNNIVEFSCVKIRR